MEIAAPTEPRESWVRTRASYIVLVAVIAHVVAAWLGRAPISWGEDDAAYLLLAQSLQQFGYRELQDIAAPIHARFPPLFPLLVAIVGAPFGNRLEPILVFVSLCSVGSIFFFFSAARRTVGEEVAVLATVLYAINPSFVADSGKPLTEVPFTLFAMIALWALTKEREGRKFAVIAGAAVICAALTRSAGVVFVVALVAYWVITKQYRRAIVFGFASVCTVGLWMAWAFAAPNPDTSRLYVADLGIRGRRAEEGVFARIVRRIVPRTQFLAKNVFPFVLAFPTLPVTVVDNVAWLVALVGFGLSGLVVLWRRWLAAALFVVAYVGLLVIWRYALERFVYPIVPLLYLMMLTGAAWVGYRFIPRARHLLPLALAAAIAVGELQRDAEYLRGRIACDRANPSESPTCHSDEYRLYLRMAHWVRDSTPADAVFFVSKERGFYLHSGRKSINQDRGLQEDSLSIGPYLRSRGVTYTIVVPVGVHSGRHGRLLAQACREFDVVKEFDGASTILRVRAESDSADDRYACRVLQSWRRTPPRPD